jgi:hypothetical protein
MLILSIDAGVTSGYVVYESETSHILTYGEFQPDETYRLAEAGISVKVVIEDPLRGFRGKLGDRLQEVQSKLHDLFPNAYHILASSWKSTRYAYISVPVYLNSTHLRDAYCIAVWYADRLLKEMK